MPNYFLSVITCFSLLWIVSFFYKRLNISKQVIEDRWSTSPIPNIGGLAVIGSLGWYVMSFEPVVIFSVVVLLVYGLVDDLVGINWAYLKITFQLAVAVGTVSYGYQLHWFNDPILDKGFTLVWIVGIINAFNLVDNMDGYLAMLAVICAITFHLLFLPAFHLSIYLVPTLLMFFIFNSPEAGIWMGDCGSLPLGYLFAVFGLEYYEAVKGFSLIPILILAYPIIDTIFVTVTRTLRGQKFWIGGSDHISHRMMRIFENEYVCLAMIGAFQGVMGVIALCLE